MFLRLQPRLQFFTRPLPTPAVDFHFVFDFQAERSQRTRIVSSSRDDLVMVQAVVLLRVAHNKLAYRLGIILKNVLQNIRTALRGNLR